MKNETGQNAGKPGALSDWNTLDYLRSYRESVTELLKLSGAAGGEDQGREEDFLFVYSSLKEDICRACPRFRICFGTGMPDGGELTDMDRGLRRLIDKNVFGIGTEEDSGDAGFCRVCVYYKNLTEEMAWLTRLLVQDRFFRNRYLHLRSMFLSGLSSQAAVLDECIRRMESDRPLPAGRKLRLSGRLLPLGCLVEDGRERRGEENSRIVRLKLRMLRRCRTSLLSGAVSGVYGFSMVCSRPEEWIPAGDHSLLFEEENHFHLLFGKCHRSKNGEELCGDTFSLIHKSRDRAILCLADGMGAGGRAFEVSRKLIEAFETLMMAGISETEALRLLHTVIYQNPEKDMSTLDIASVSLKTGIVRFIKAGGAATFIRHRWGVERIRDDSLPLGYLNLTRTGSRNKKLYDGDRIIMLSDGMLSFEGKEGEDRTMEEIIEGIGECSVRHYAERLMEAVPAGREGTDDDRTVLVALVCERGKKHHVG